MKPLTQQLSLAVDEDFNHRILKGLQFHYPDLHWLLVRDVPGVGGTDDVQVLEWAAGESRIVVSHDVNTMRAAAAWRIHQGLRMPGLILVHQSADYGQVIEALALAAYCSEPEEWEGKISYLPE